MKQYTTPEQTAKLIELGFEKPKSITSISWDVPEDDSPFINANSIEFECHYSIGELIEIINRVEDEELRLFRDEEFWSVTTDFYGEANKELVDALYSLAITLKKVGAI